MAESTMSQYELRVLLWSWGLMVDLGLTARVEEGKPKAGISVAPSVWLVVAPGVRIGDMELPHLLSGLRRVASRVSADRSADGKDLVFVLDHLWFPLTDFQDEALELAVIGWAAQDLGIEDEPADVTFDRDDNRYKIQYAEEVWEVEA